MQKAPGPNSVSPLVLKQCLDELAPMYNKLFQKNADEKEIPKYGKFQKLSLSPRNEMYGKINTWKNTTLH